MTKLINYNESTTINYSHMWFISPPPSFNVIQFLTIPQVLFYVLFSEKAQCTHVFRQGHRFMGPHAYRLGAAPQHGEESRRPGRGNTHFCATCHSSYITFPPTI